MPQLPAAVRAEAFQRVLIAVYNAQEAATGLSSITVSEQCRSVSQAPSEDAEYHDVGYHRYASQASSTHSHTRDFDVDGQCLLS